MKIIINHTTIELLKGDITVQDTEAVVNAANKRLSPGGGVAGAIHKAAGPQLWKECQTLGGCETGEVKITSGYNLAASSIIHTVGPIYSGTPQDAYLLESCYRKILESAVKHKIKNISFPAISAGTFGYPLKEAAEIALKTVIRYPRSSSNINVVRFVLHDEKALKIYEEILTAQNIES